MGFGHLLTSAAKPGVVPKEAAEAPAMTLCVKLSRDTPDHHLSRSNFQPGRRNSTKIANLSRCRKRIRFTVLRFKLQKLHSFGPFGDLQQHGNPLIIVLYISQIISVDHACSARSTEPGGSFS